MRVLLTGAAGQLGQALVASAPPGIQLIATSRVELDLADPAACRSAVATHQPAWVINAGAYTGVDLAETNQDLAMAVNAGAPRAFAEALANTQGKGRLLQLSTDFVFNGSQGTPYRVDQMRDPLGVYGRSKAKGEEAVEEVLDPAAAVILRTSWVMGPVGRNFALTMLRLHQTKDVISVVADQVGCPTSTITLAKACWRVVECDADPMPPVLHWSDAGAASWYDVAVAVGELGQELGLLEHPATVQPICTAEYPTPARRPDYSLLDCVGSRKALALDGQHWRAALHSVLMAIPPQSTQP